MSSIVSFFGSLNRDMLTCKWMTWVTGMTLITDTDMVCLQDANWLHSCTFELMIIIMIIIIIIALKGAIFFHNLLAALWAVSNRYTQMAWAQSCAYHVQHIKHFSCATCHSAIEFDGVEIAYILPLLYWLKPFTSERREETRVPGENPCQWASENATY